MIKLENTEVIGWEHAIRGMRNPKNSWDRSDSQKYEQFDVNSMKYSSLFDIGENDHKLMMQLAAGGPVHAKYRRMIAVYVDITAPLYWWKEFDTYKVGTVANSCSTMHKIHAKQFTAEDFSYDHLMSDDGKDCPLLQDPNDYDNAFDPTNVFVLTINMLNACRKKYLDVDAKLHRTDLDLSQETIMELTKLKKDLWWQMIQLLPSSYNQKRTVMLNYEVLAGIYPMRKTHKLDEWHVFCDWIKSLPYSELITGEGMVHVEFEEVPNEVPETTEKVSEEVAETAGDEEVPEGFMEEKCNYCNGTGMVQVAPNARGIKKCPICNGTGKVGLRR